MDTYTIVNLIKVIIAFVFDLFKHERIGKERIIIINLDCIVVYRSFYNRVLAKPRNGKVGVILKFPNKLHLHK